MAVMMARRETRVKVVRIAASQIRTPCCARRQRFTDSQCPTVRSSIWELRSSSFH